MMNFYIIGVNDEGCRFIFHALRENTSLHTLHLAGNNVTYVGSRYCSDALLYMNETLTCLNLDNNALGPDGCQYLAEILKRSETIAELYLSNNGILDDGACHLAMALMINTSLKKLSLDHNDITKNGKEGLAQALSVNPNIHMLMKL
jgi:Ran GTPase-activating protein (RanGAP) involved in mRNA processing and transport